MEKTMSFRLWVLSVLLLWVASAPFSAWAQDDQKKALPEHMPLAEWLAGPERHDFKCEMELSPARLTFQQRNMVQLRADVDPAPEDRRKDIDLYLIVKVADASGKWLQSATHRHFHIPAGFDKNSMVEYTTGFYATPGSYIVALIVFDALSGKVSVLRKPLQVKPPKNDPLPQLDRNLPAIDFLADVPSSPTPVQPQEHFRNVRRPQEFLPPHPEDEWPPGRGREYLPVRNVRPLRVDVILNVSAPVDESFLGNTPVSQYRSTAGIISQLGAILSHLDVENGCVRVSALDLSQLGVVFDRVDGQTADWDKLAKMISDRETNTINVRALGHGVADDRSGCGTSAGPIEHAIIFVSRNFSFPSGGRGERYVAGEPGDVRYFQFRINRGAGSDDLVRFFQPAHPRRFDVDSPEQFRSSLADLIAALGGASDGGK
jgi:hypothetical protein